METNNPITVKTIINAPAEKVWKLFSEPEHIIHWNQASDDWYAPEAENDLRVDGKFRTKMAAKDGSVSFNFEGTYTNVQENSLITYVLDDNRKVNISFKEGSDVTEVTETFDPENTHLREVQQGGWQAILDNFKKYVEEN